MSKRLLWKLLVTGLCISCFGQVYAVERGYTISGTIRHPGAGRIYVYLVDEAVFKTPLTGLQVTVLDADRLGRAFFSFNSVARGEYGIRCYLDINGNGKLDGGLFGPKEPWGMSWKADKTSRWPRFNNISFKVDRDIGKLDITLK